MDRPAHSAGSAQAREFLQKPLQLPKFVQVLSSLASGGGLPAWDSLHEGAVQLRPLGVLWGGPVLVFRGIHVNYVRAPRNPRTPQPLI